MNDPKDLQALHDLLLPDDPQVGVPFAQSWMVGVLSAPSETESRPWATCDSAGCAAPAVVIARAGNGAGLYCEACWRRDELVRFLDDLASSTRTGESPDPEVI